MLRNLWCFKFLKNPATSFITWWAACSQVTRWLVFTVTWSLYSWRMLLLFTKFMDFCFYILDNTGITNKYHLVTGWRHDLKNRCWKVPVKSISPILYFNEWTSAECQIFGLGWEHHLIYLTYSYLLRAFWLLGMWK